MGGKIVIISAPSGAGKSTLVQHLLKNNAYRFEFSVSACSRKPRNGEIEGTHYYFMSIEDFRKKIEEDEFIEWEEVYRGQYYGTLKSEVDRILEKENNILFDVDVMGGISLKGYFKDKALAIFIKPPSIETLEERLKGRNTETEKEIQKRVRKAKHEMRYAEKFDHIIINDNLETAQKELEQLIAELLNKS
jgi:guanylate kinase